VKKSFIAVFAIAVVTTSLSAQSKPSAQASVQGAWKVIEITTTGPGASTNKNPQPGLYLFTGKHYSLTRVDGETPRTGVADNATATADQLRDVLRFAAQAGTYEITGGELVLRRVAALSAANMVSGNIATYSYKLDGNTLTLTPRTTQGAPATNPTTIKLTRVE
jgi:hypothetical protein